MGADHRDAIIAVRLPLTEPFAISHAIFPDVPTVLVGRGEGAPDAFVTGETFGGVAETLREIEARITGASSARGAGGGGAGLGGAVRQRAARRARPSPCRERRTYGASCG